MALKNADGLTPKQKLFVAEYLIDLNATAAAKRAGYSPKCARISGCDNLKRPAVIAALAKAQAKREKRTELSQDWIIEKLRENTDRALQAVAVEIEGEAVGEYRYEGSVANRALELLGKHLGMFADRLHVEGPMLNLSLLDDEEVALLRRLLAKARGESVEHDG